MTTTTSCKTYIDYRHLNVTFLQLTPINIFLEYPMFLFKFGSNFDVNVKVNFLAPEEVAGEDTAARHARPDAPIDESEIAGN